MSRANEEPGPGEVIGQYRLESLLGRGGMGSVFAATHVRLGKKRAVKILRDHLAADKIFLGRFFHEAKIVTEIGHPNIIDVVDFVETDEPRRVAYVMELVAGPSLRALLSRYQTTREQTLNVGIQLASALEAVHAIQVVHRDLKPDNVIVVGKVDGDFSESPSIKILDFGIAKIFGREDVLETATGQVVGTPLYMAPEQIAAGPVSPATDTYAIAEILYEMASGVRVFPKDRVQALRMKLASTAPVLAPPRWPDGERFLALVHACLNPDPNRRPSLPQLSQALSELAASAVAPSAPTLKRPTSSRPNEPEAVIPTRAERSSPGLDSKAERTPARQPNPLSTMPERPLATFDSLAASAVSPTSKLPVMLSAAATVLAALALIAVLLRSPEKEVAAEVVAEPPSSPIATATPPQTTSPSPNVTPTPQTQPTAVEPTKPAAPPTQVSPAPTPPVSPAPASPSTDAPKSRPEVIKALKKARVESNPPGAEVTDLDSGKLLGRTPLEVGAKRVRLSLPGHDPKELELGGQDQRVELTPAKESVVKKKKLNPW
ncbi:MAG: protein kinase [Deltaproteobacteria bacterium]|nr:protein kinase [Deltaproteobacteria bacterium]